MLQSMGICISNLPTLVVVGTGAGDALAGNTTTINSTQAGNITTNNGKVGYTDALVKTKLNTETVISISAQITALGYSTTDNELTTEEVQDIVGGMVSGNTESGITVTYDDVGNSLDFSVASQTENDFTTVLKDKLDGVAAGATNTIGNATHTGEVTGSGALTISDNVVDEANLKVSNSPTNGYFLSAQSGNSGGLTWATVPAGYNDADVASYLASASSVGIGVVPESWNSAFNGVLQVGTYGVMAGTSGSAQFGSNFYYDGAYKRINTNCIAFRNYSNVSK